MASIVAAAAAHHPRVTTALARLTRVLPALLFGALAATALGACEDVATPTRLPGVTVTAPPSPAGPVERVRVVRVVDGDTVVIEAGGRQDRLRYIGIDAPESVRPDTPVEPFGREAAAANEALVAGREVLLERDVSDRDEFGRLLRYVWLETDDGPLMVNFELIARGFAQAVTFPPDVRHAELFRAAEREARTRGRGLWSAGASSSPAVPTGD